VIDRDEVLHVARLARLELSDEEVQRMTAELAKVLDHIEQISELDLDDVAPTSHVVDVSNAVREDVARPSWPREVMLSQAPEVVDGGFAVPSPQADALADIP
jgi:aspartyl-tRNA(Asn)/glutamyl-tRNA(Gln) amidotransferase subunit C